MGIADKIYKAIGEYCEGRLEEHAPDLVVMNVGCFAQLLSEMKPWECVANQPHIQTMFSGEVSIFGIQIVVVSSLRYQFQLLEFDQLERKFRQDNLQMVAPQHRIAIDFTYMRSCSFPNSATYSNDQGMGSAIKSVQTVHVDGHLYLELFEHYQHLKHIRNQRASKHNHLLQVLNSSQAPSKKYQV